MHNVTLILEAIDAGDPFAAERLLPIVYDELRRMAAVKLANEKPGQTLDATALVHEAYLRLVGDQQFKSRGHFFAAAAETMRRILVDQARRKASAKRGDDREREELPESRLAAPEVDDDLLALDAALTELGGVDAQAAELVKLRYFAGLTLAQTADAMGISSRSADRIWVYARSWLYKKINGA